MLARQRFASGLVDCQTVLETQRNQPGTQDSVASADRVRLYKALGGDWHPERSDAIPAPSKPGPHRHEYPRHRRPGQDPLGRLARRTASAALVPPPFVVVRRGAAGAGGAGLWFWQARQTAAAAPNYTTHAVTRGNLTLTVVANGTLQPTRSVNIGSELSGTG